MFIQKNAAKKLLLWGGVVLVFAAIFGFLWWMFDQSNPANVSVTPISASDWTRGEPNAAVTIIEYSDFECPACKVYFPFVEQVVKDGNGSVRAAYRHFPLSQHPYALSASYAAEAAGVQGKFWEMATLLFEKQDIWAQSKTKSDAENLFVQYAGQLRLNTDKFRIDMASQAISDKVLAQYQMGVHDRISWTPTIFVNNTRIQNPGTYADFKALIDQASHAAQ